MPWADNREIETHYLRMTWYPGREEMESALALVHSLPVTGIEYEDGLEALSPFTDIPLTPGRPFVRIYLPETAASGPVASRVTSLCQDRAWRLECETVQTVDWANSWKEHYYPQRIGSDYAVVPAWYERSPASPDRTLWLDPGMAFGTGSHATTRLCLNALARLPLAGARVLDLGAGSGILGLFAALRGAAQVVMVEPDPVAVDAIAHNARINHLQNQVQVIAGTLRDVAPTSFDVLCLNLIWDIIAHEWDRLPHYAAAGSTLLLSGILAEREDDVKTLVSGSDFAMADMVRQDGWLMAEVRNDSYRG